MYIRISRGNDTIDRGSITDVDVLAVGGDSDAIRLAQCVVYDPDLACRGTEAVALGAELRGCVG